MCVQDRVDRAQDNFSTQSALEGLRAQVGGRGGGRDGGRDGGKGRGVGERKRESPKAV